MRERPSSCGSRATRDPRAASVGAAPRRTTTADAYVVWFGDAEATDVELLAPGVVVARVPAEVAAGPAAVRAAVRAADGALTQLAGEVAFEVERGR